MRSFTLSEDQVKLAYDVANQIQNSKEYAKKWSIDNIALGLLGETAYGLMNDMQINTDIWNDRGDGGTDFPDGTDVKTISYTGSTPQLKMNKLPDDKCRVEKFVLAVCDIKRKPNEVHLIGEISADNFKSKASLRQYGNKFWYAVTPEDLDTVY